MNDVVRIARACGDRECTNVKYATQRDSSAMTSDGMPTAIATATSIGTDWVEEDIVVGVKAQWL